VERSQNLSTDCSLQSASFDEVQFVRALSGRYDERIG
jgi:hypothetical protein